MLYTRADLVGKINKRLTVINFSHIYKFAAMWQVSCICGNFLIMSTTAFKNSSGRCIKCAGKDNGVSRRKDPFFVAIKYLMTRYKRQAKIKNRVFSLSVNQVIYLTQQICYYCGDLPAQIYENRYYKHTFLYNGIDRVDNEKGYTEDNSVSCCGICNMMKQALSIEQFYAHIEKIRLKKVDK